MSQSPTDLPIVQLPPTELTRRELLVRSAAWTAAAAMAMRLAEERVAAQASPVPVDPDQLQQLIDLSRMLCGGGNFSTDRATVLMQLIGPDPALAAGLDELLATPPVAGQPLGSEQAGITALAILNFWYADVFSGAPLPDRGSAYYQLTAWQAMYTPSWAICKAFGSWADPPGIGPLVPSIGLSPSPSN
jgi:hypothetical protein